MAAYAALLSLMHIIEKIERHPSPPISLHKGQVESLTETLNFLQEFLEGYGSPFEYSDEADPLEIRIADAAHAAEDVIETEIVDCIPGRSSTNLVQEFLEGYRSPFDYSDEADPLKVRIADAAEDVIETETVDRILDQSTTLEKAANFSNLSLAYECASTRDHFNEDLQKVIEEMELIKKDVTEMVREIKAAVEPQFHGSISGDDVGERNSHEMVGCDDVLLQLLDRLAGGDSSRQIIPVVGMGGIGKTTLAKTVFEHPLIIEKFDVCVWATISQDYNVKGTLDEVLSKVRGKSRDKSEKELGEELYKFLCGSKYFVVMDDLWSLEVWDKLKFYFPEYNNGSRILVTTRMSNLAGDLTNSNNFLKMKILDEGSAWKLFSKIVLGVESFHVELKQIGKRIVERCKGLPLSIVVIGGLLTKSPHTPQHWHEIERNLSSENDEYCLPILKTSYNHLPAYLKPCFLYMGTFEEDSVISVSKLIRLWVCEGFLKPINNKSPETIAEEYLEELVDRNLVLVHRLGVLGNLKSCKIHDLLRDLSLKEAHKQRFYHVVSGDSRVERSSSHRRIVVHKGFNWELNVNNYLPHARSYNDAFYSKELPHSSRLLRTLNTDYYYGLDDLLQFVNSRYVDAGVLLRQDTRIPSSISQLWNLHTLIIRCEYLIIAPRGIWKMSQLRHVEFEHDPLKIPNPPRSKDIVVMENLHTLKGVRNLELTEEVVKRIPNIQKLRLYYQYDKRWKRSGVNCISYLHCLETLYLSFSSPSSTAYLQKITSFPHSLKKFTLRVSDSCKFDLNDMLPKIGWLPHLQKLKLIYGVFGRRKWETSEGQFPSLKFLTLCLCRNLENWTVSESSHFPRLQELRLEGLEGPTLEIPSEIGDIATLKTIVVEFCSESVVLSAKKIADEQQDLCGDLHVTAIVYKEEEALQSLEQCPNFQVLYK